MGDVEPQDAESQSERVRPPSPTPPECTTRKRFRVTTSNINGTLAQISDEAATMYHEVAQGILGDDYQGKNTL